jgi:hypothetical protein
MAAVKMLTFCMLMCLVCLCLIVTAYPSSNFETVDEVQFRDGQDDDCAHLAALIAKPPATLGTGALPRVVSCNFTDFVPAEKFAAGIEATGTQTLAFKDGNGVHMKAWAPATTSTEFNLQGRDPDAKPEDFYAGIPTTVKEATATPVDPNQGPPPELMLCNNFRCPRDYKMVLQIDLCVCRRIHDDK